MVQGAPPRLLPKPALANFNFPSQGSHACDVFQYFLNCLPLAPSGLRISSICHPVVSQMSSRCGFPDVASQLVTSKVSPLLSSCRPLASQQWFSSCLPDVVSQFSLNCFPGHDSVPALFPSCLTEFVFPISPNFFHLSADFIPVVSKLFFRCCLLLVLSCLPLVLQMWSLNCLPVCSGVASAVSHFPPPTPSCLPDVPRITLHCLPLGLPIASLSLEFETVIAKLAGLFARILCCSDCQPVKDQ